MAIMPAEAQESFAKAPYVVFCTATKDAQPNGSIVGLKKVIDDSTVYLSDQFFKKTLANFQANEKVSVVWFDGEKAFQLYGTVRYVNEGAEFEEQAAWANAFFEEKGRPVRAKGGCFLAVDAVYNTSAGPTAGDQIA